MATYAKFDEGKYKALFDQMYGAGTYASGMDMAKNIGRTTAEADFAKENYLNRLKEAKEAAERAREMEEYYASLDLGENHLDSLIDQWRKEREESNKSNLDRYYDSQSEALNKGRSLARKKVEDVYPGIIKPPAQNKNLTPWEKYKMFGG